jgi:hypothetical protein
MKINLGTWVILGLVLVVALKYSGMNLPFFSVVDMPVCDVGNGLFTKPQFVSKQSLERYIQSEVTSYIRGTCNHNYCIVKVYVSGYPCIEGSRYIGDAVKGQNINMETGFGSNYVCSVSAYYDGYNCPVNGDGNNGSNIIIEPIAFLGLLVSGYWYLRKRRGK